MCAISIWIQFELTILSSSGVGNGRDRGIVRGRCSRGGHGCGDLGGGGLEDPLRCRPGVLSPSRSSHSPQDGLIIW